MNFTGKKFKLWREHGALNSKPIFDAFEYSLNSAGHTVVNSLDIEDSDIHVIWSVLWHGRMSRNRQIWDSCQKINKPVVVLEVGSIKRGVTWKVGLNGINRSGYFGPLGNSSDRSVSLGLQVKPWRTNGEYILICGQHEKSLQWQNQARMSDWFLRTYDEIRKYSDRPIIFRPHPRCRLPHIERGLKHVYRQEPQRLCDTYDDFDLNFDNIFSTINFSSNPGIHSIIQGVPAFVSNKSLAYDVANDIDSLYNIETPKMPDRTQWLNDYAWTEYTVEEIAQGLPLKRLTFKLM